MRIVGIEDLHADGGWRTFSYLKVTTDEGITGWAEYSDGFTAGAVTAVIHRLAKTAIGMDPRQVGVLNATLHAVTRMTIGGLHQEAIAAIENACVDIKAKALGVPVYDLFGGPFRTRLPLYWSHCGTFRVTQRAFFENELRLPPIRTLDDFKKLGEEVVARGFPALKTNPVPLRPGDPPFSPGFRIVPGFLDRNIDNRMISGMMDLLSAFRDGIGPDTGLMIDLNFSQRTEGFMRVAKALEPFDLTWLEIDIHDPASLAQVRRSTATPIASLEAVHGLGNYRPYFEAQAAGVAIVDVPWNGIWESVRIATLADAYEVNVAPHNFYGALASLISAHFCASIPNFRIMEIEVDDVPWKNDLITTPVVLEDGHLLVPDRPGWGADVNEDAVREHPPRGPRT